MLKIAAVVLAIVFLFTGCSTNPPNENQKEIPLVTGGYGYEVGDVVLLDTAKEPEIGDIVQYNWQLNKSDCLGMGPGVYLAKIIGLPGDSVIFTSSVYEANGITATWNGPLRTIWGTEIIDEISDRQLKVPEGELLADKWIGQECRGTDEHGSSLFYSRFTVKKEAITGVVIEKVGHDEEFELQEKGKVY